MLGLLLPNPEGVAMRLSVWAYRRLELLEHDDKIKDPTNSGPATLVQGGGAFGEFA